MRPRKLYHSSFQNNNSCSSCWTPFSEILLVACTRLYNPLRPSVRRSSFSTFLTSFALPVLPKCLDSLFYQCPCPTARDFGSPVYGLIFTDFRFEEGDRWLMYFNAIACITCNNTAFPFAITYYINYQRLITCIHIIINDSSTAFTLSSTTHHLHSHDHQ